MTEPSSSSRFTTIPFGEPLIGALLRARYEVVRRAMLDHLAAQGFAGIDAAHMNVLLYPGPDGLRPSDLAARLQTSKQALNYLLGELERRGYLERLPDPDDHRSKRIALTARGREAGLAMREAVAGVEREWSARLGEERFGQLRELLVELGDES